MNEHAIGFLVLSLCWSPALYVACDGQEPPAAPSGYDVPESDPAPTREEPDGDPVNPDYPGAFEVASVAPTGTGTGGSGGGGSGGSGGTRP